MKNEKEALALLEATDAALVRVAEEASTEITTARQAVESHATALARFRQTGQGLLPAVAARNWLDSFDGLVNPGVTNLGASANASRTQFFDNQKLRLENASRERYLRQHAAATAAALGKIIEVRSQGREKWRGRIADEIAQLDRGLLLNTTPHDRISFVNGEMTRLENELLSADAQHGEATRLTSRLRSNHGSDDVVQVYSDAKGFVLSLPNYEAS